jgi:hypothetical protein
VVSSIEFQNVQDRAVENSTLHVSTTTHWLTMCTILVQAASVKQLPRVPLGDSDRQSAACLMYLSYTYSRSREHGVENGKYKQDLSKYPLPMHVRGIRDLDYMTLLIEDQGECTVVEIQSRGRKKEAKIWKGIWISLLQAKERTHVLSGTT